MVKLNALSAVVLTLGLSSTFYSSAATHPTTASPIVPDNVVVCQANSGCTSQTMFGRTYKVLRTDRLVVMVSISGEGAYTRADVSVLNTGSYPTKVIPDDFRVEVVSPKPHVLLYVAPENLPPPTPEPDVKAPETAPAPAAAATPEDPSKPLDVDQLYIANKKQLAAQEAAGKVAAQKQLQTTVVSPNEVVRGRVYFERDKSSRKAELVNVVLPIGGMVYQFPYVIQR